MGNPKYDIGDLVYVTRDPSITLLYTGIGRIVSNSDPFYDHKIETLENYCGFDAGTQWGCFVCNLDKRTEIT